AVAARPAWVPPGKDSLELSFHPDSRLLDGRYANNAWLQELPDPITKLTWDTVAILSPKTAEELKVTTGDYIYLSGLGGGGGREIGAPPVFVLPGQAD